MNLVGAVICQVSEWNHHRSPGLRPRHLGRLFSTAALGPDSIGKNPIEIPHENPNELPVKKLHHKKIQEQVQGDPNLTFARIFMSIFFQLNQAPGVCFRDISLGRFAYYNAIHRPKIDRSGCKLRYAV